jgi:hypothetical protein
MKANYALALAVLALVLLSTVPLASALVVLDGWVLPGKNASGYYENFLVKNVGTESAVVTMVGYYLPAEGMTWVDIDPDIVLVIYETKVFQIPPYFQQRYTEGLRIVVLDSNGISHPIKMRPVADFAYSVNGLTVQFTDNSYDEGWITSWSWNFGDNATSTSQNPPHTYGNPGTYTVILKVADDDGLTDNKTVTLYLQGFSVSVSPASGTVVQGGSATATVTVTSVAGFSGTVALSASDNLPSVTENFSSENVTLSADNSASSTLTISTLASTSPGTYPITITGTGGSLTRSCSYALTVRLAAPSSLSASAASSSQINLSWTDASTGEDGFKIERKTGAGGTYAEIATVGANTTSYSDTGLSASTTYYYRVRAYKGGDYSDYSNEASATTQSSGGGSSPPPDVPATVYATLKDINTSNTIILGAEYSITSVSNTGSAYLYKQDAHTIANAATLTLGTYTGNFSATISGSATGYYSNSVIVSGTYSLTKYSDGHYELSLSPNSITIYLTPYPGNLSSTLSNSWMTFSAVGQSYSSTLTVSGNYPFTVNYSATKTVFDGMGGANWNVSSPSPSSSSVPGSSSITVTYTSIGVYSGGTPIQGQVGTVYLQATGTVMVADGSGNRAYTPYTYQYIGISQNVGY